MAAEAVCANDSAVGIERRDDMTEPIRILQWGMLGGFGGVEAFIMNVYRNLDRSKVQFDFLESHNEGKLA